MNGKPAFFTGTFENLGKNSSLKTLQSLFKP